jgi:hypothetical protein
LETGAHFFVQADLDQQSSYFMLPAIAGMAAAHHHAQFFLLRRDLSSFSALAGLEPWSFWCQPLK